MGSTDAGEAAYSPMVVSGAPVARKRSVMNRVVSGATCVTQKSAGSSRRPRARS